MARITESLLVQRVDKLIVFKDESTGEEVTFPVEVTPTVLRVLVYLAAEFEANP